MYLNKLGERQMFRKALFMVDVQNDFCSGGRLAIPGGDQVIEPLNRMVDYATRPVNQADWIIYASGDQHPRKTKHFKKWGGIWPIHCVQGTPGAEFHPELKTEFVEFGVIPVFKGIQPGEDGYSAFEGKTDINGYLLEECLRHFKVQEIYIGGLATDYCVKATALDAVKKGFKTYLFTDACRAVNIKPGDEVKALNEMANVGVIFTTTDEVIHGC